MRINVVGISGSRIVGGNCEAVLQKALSFFGEQSDVSTELISLADEKIEGCKHCNWCLRNQTKDKFCAISDGMDAIYPKLLEADILLLASPVHFGRLSGHLAAAIDRLRVFVHGNMYGQAMKNKLGGAIAVAHIRGAGVETTLLSLQATFHVLGMITVGSPGGYHLGAACFSSQQGSGPLVKGVRHMAVDEDEFGVTTLKRLSGRLLELAQIIKTGQANLA